VPNVRSVKQDFERYRVDPQLDAVSSARDFFSLSFLLIAYFDLASGTL